MKQMAFRLGLATKANKKKKTEFFLTSSNKIFYFTFLLSIIIHVGLIFTIPPVELFSEGLASPSEAIVVDLYQDTASEVMPEVSHVNDNQFLSTDPSAKIESDTPEEQAEIEQSDSDMAFPTLDDIQNLDNEYTLLSQTDTREPQFPLLKKHSSEKLPLRVQPTLSKSQQTQKLSTHPIEATPLQVRPRAEAPEPLKIKPLHDKPLPTREKTENQLDFPLSANKSIERADSSQVLSGKQLEFGTSRLVEKKRDSSSLQSSFDGGTSTFKRRQFGIPKEKETDKNQFGIFAGRRVEEPQLKDAVQEIVQPEEKKENLTEEAEAAKALQTEEQIEGPVKGRALIRRPQPPKVDISIDVELKFKFWVLPDGTIGEVIPVKRGNAQLERIAIAYLKQWRFEPLPSGASQEKIWGTIPIRFSVQ